MDNTYINKVENLAKKLESTIFASVDVKYNVYVYINGLAVHDDCFEIGAAGRGLTYADACKDYIKRLCNINEDEYLMCKGQKFYLTI